MRTYKIFVNPSDFRELKKNYWSEDFIAGTLFDGDQKYQIELGIRGHHIRSHRKKSYDILFVRPLFLRKIKEFHLNSEYRDPSLIRNKLSMDFFRAIGVLAPEAEHVLLYINGMFQGVYLQLEAFNEDSLIKRNLPNGPIFYAINDDANFSLLTAEGDPKPELDEGYTQKSGAEEERRFLLELLVKINTLPDDKFNRQIGNHLDIDKYLRWLAGAVCTQNFDGFVHNYALYRNMDTGLFEISPWDYDGTWGRDLHGEEMEPDYIPIQGYNTLTARILEFQKYRNQYRDILVQILEQQFTKDFLAPIIKEMLKKIEPYVEKDPYIKQNKQMFLDEYSYILTFIKNRNAYLKENLHTLD